MSIDNDDFFMPDIFNICYEEAENNNISIIEFSGCDKSIYKLFKNNNCKTCRFLRYKQSGIIIRQPKLSTFIYKKKRRGKEKYMLIDGFIWGKCIKTEIYKRALELIGEEIYTQNICWCEDRIINFALFRVANSFKFINRKGYVHNNNPYSVWKTWLNNKRDRVFHDELINIQSIYNITKNSKDSIYAVYEFQKIWKYVNSELTFNNKEMAKYLYNNFLNDSYIPEYKKHVLINLINKTFKKL